MTFSAPEIKHLPTDIHKLKEKRFTLAHEFSRILFVVFWLQDRIAMVEWPRGGKLLISWSPGDRQKKQEMETKILL